MWKENHKEKMRDFHRNYYSTHEEYRKRAIKRTAEWQRAHREYRKEYNRQWYLRNKEKQKDQRSVWYTTHREQVFASSLRRLYGISLKEYEEMLTKQGGRCKICLRPQSSMKRRFSVDHDHDTGQIRGILCINCNSAIGLFQKGSIYISLPEVLKRVGEYLFGA